MSMTLEQAEAIRQHACGRKVQLGRGAALNLATAERASGLRAYRCSFSTDGHWHVGHPMGMDSLQRMAEAIRVLAGNAPGVPGGIAA